MKSLSCDVSEILLFLVYAYVTVCDHDRSLSFDTTDKVINLVRT